jgi:HSP20 family molecular chaperone IbpA
MSMQIMNRYNDVFNSWDPFWDLALWSHPRSRNRKAAVKLQANFNTAARAIRSETLTIDGVFKLLVGAPGLSRDDFDVSLKGRKITVKTVGKNDDENRESFLFEYELYDHQDADSITVKMKNGLLELEIPELVKDPLEDTERKIEISN